MQSTQSLPLELWITIFDFAIGSSTGPSESCSYRNFPIVLDHLRGWRRPWQPQVLRSLRLVCRTFHNLLESPSYYSMEAADEHIPPRTKALTLGSYQNTNKWLRKLDREPSIYCRIIHLFLVLLDKPDPSHGGETTFDCLCASGHGLPALRSLSIKFYSEKSRGTPKPRFWARINDAFPLLTSLVLRGKVGRSVQEGAAVFENLIVLGITVLHPDVALVTFPALVHVAIDNTYARSLLEFGNWNHLESLFLRHLPYDCARFKWEWFPNLRLLGIPDTRLASTPLLPSHHPLQSLYVYSGADPLAGGRHKQGEKDVWWLHGTLLRLPGIINITITFEKSMKNWSSTLLGDFDRRKLKQMGFTFGPSNLTFDYRRRVVINRTPAKDKKAVKMSMWLLNINALRPSASSQ